MSVTLVKEETVFSMFRRIAKERRNEQHQRPNAHEAEKITTTLRVEQRMRTRMTVPYTARSRYSHDVRAKSAIRERTNDYDWLNRLRPTG